MQDYPYVKKSFSQKKLKAPHSEVRGLNDKI